MKTSPQNMPNVLMFLGSGFEDLEAVTIIDVCGWTAYRDHVPDVKITITAFHPEIRGRFGVTIKRDIPFEKIVASDYAAFVLPGGFGSHGYDEVHDCRIYDLMRAIHAQDGMLATMCIGILPVAEAGLLKGIRATTYPHSHHDNAAQLREYGAVTLDEPVVIDSRIISCRGPAQAIDVALLLLEDLLGTEASAEVRHYTIAEDR
ncbi:MAG: DJ-1/PfpI family protein [Candidatus Latescibacteria bacterium]|jgi:4-methyl-5(b-hydroxyethyl)-thiazole monophosphate biosynthesis|nr:DJ-1/PfpI family protein [Candidatus Latescibacterota bacterium]